ncbi:MAG: hypothetical protein RJA76_23 [Bacteroidota bacterium]|jgi:dTDP-4-amino-4,6-dideoxygalactose transaminase
MLNVTKTFLPSLSEYSQYLERIWANGQVTNEGPFVKELENELVKFTGVKNVIYVSNGTIALQLLIKALKIKDKVITTPFSYCATTNSLIWEGCEPIFADINPISLTCELNTISDVMTDDINAILTTHVYGNAEGLELVEEHCKQRNIPLIFDGAHCFGVNYKGKSIFNYGTASTCSFHATKIFHTIEGGAIFTNDDLLADKLRLLKSFGHKGDDYFLAGINGKTSEFHAIMGLINLKHFQEIKNHRKISSELYDELLNSNKKITIFKWGKYIEKNYSYYPIILPSEEILNTLVAELQKQNIFPRRYFYPSLNTLPFLEKQPCIQSENIANRILCLPLSAEILKEEIIQVCNIINQVI